MLILLYLLLTLRDGRCLDDPTFVTKTSPAGDPVMLKCSRRSEGTVFWMRIVEGKSPEVFRETKEKPSTEGPNIKVKREPGELRLRIIKAELKDSAVYICLRSRNEIVEVLNVTYLKIVEPATTKVPSSAPVCPVNSVTVRCSVLRDFQNESSLSEDSLICFSLTSNNSHANTNRTLGNGDDEHGNCETVAATNCFFSYSANFSSCDAWTHAAAAHEEKTNNNKSKPDIAENTCSCRKNDVIVHLFGAALAISMMLIVFLICLTVKLKNRNIQPNVTVCLQTQTSDQENQQTDEDSLVYATPAFVKRKSHKAEAQNSEEETIYTNVKVLEI